MGTYNLALITKKIYDSGLTLFYLKTLKDILGIGKEGTTFNILKRLVKNEVLLKIEKDKYILKNAKISDFTLANFVYQPSYLSFESALNFYGILSQFPYEITSATSKKTKRKEIDGKVFSYSHIKKELFWGYEKKEDFLIAFPEKALLDQLYLVSKGLKRAALDEYDFSFLDLPRLKKYLGEYPKTRETTKMREILKKYLKR